MLLSINQFNESVLEIRSKQRRKCFCQSLKALNLFSSELTRHRRASGIKYRYLKSLYLTATTR